jgi:hypothetical protein
MSTWLVFTHVAAWFPRAKSMEPAALQVFEAGSYSSAVAR